MSSGEKLSFKYEDFLYFISAVGVVLLNSTGETIDIITRTDKYVIHKQVQRKNGLLFMRAKKRLLRKA